MKINIYWMVDMLMSSNSIQHSYSITCSLLLLCVFEALPYSTLSTFLCLCFRITESSLSREKQIPAVSMFPWAQSCTHLHSSTAVGFNWNLHLYTYICISQIKSTACLFSYIVSVNTMYKPWMYKKDYNGKCINIVSGVLIRSSLDFSTHCLLTSLLKLQGFCYVKKKINTI